MPTKVAAPSTPSAASRARPLNRWLARAIDSGTSAPPPKPCTTRDAMSQVMPSSCPAKRDNVQPARAPQVGAATGERHGHDVREQVGVDDPAHPRQVGPAAEVGHD